MSTLAEQVVEQLKTDMDNVYDAGYQKGVSETDGYGVGYNDGQADFGIQNEVTGTNIVTCDYVNENEHNVEVKLSSDTVTDFSGVEVIVLGKNLFNVNSEKKPSYTFDDNTGELKYYGDSGTTAVLDYIPLAPNEQFIIHGEIRNSTYKRFALWFYDLEKNYIKTHTANANSYSFITDENTYYCRITYKSIYEETIQLERGTKTQYEQYVEPKTYLTNADGTVDGVTSISPIMNIICDTEGVDITAKYYCTQDVEWHRFWDIFQAYGSLTTYTRIFNGTGWVDKNFKPKYPITPIQADYMFWNSRITDNPYVREIDFSQVQNMNYCFQNSTIEHVGVIDTRKCGGVTGVFHSATKLHTIDKMIFSETSSLNTNIFQSANALENILVEGTIGKSINFSWCPLLSDASVQSIIDCLADLTGQTTQTLTFHADVKAKLTEEQIATITSKNWTLA